MGTKKGKKEMIRSFEEYMTQYYPLRSAVERQSATDLSESARAMAETSLRTIRSRLVHN